MTKRIDIDGKSYRVRRGRLVQIPEEWLDQTTHPQTKRKRPSKWTRKLKMGAARGWIPKGTKTHPRNQTPRHRGNKALHEWTH